MEVNRILYVGVISVKTYKGMSKRRKQLTILLNTDVEELKRREQTELDTLVVYAIKYEC